MNLKELRAAVAVVVAALKDVGIRASAVRPELALRASARLTTGVNLTLISSRTVLRFEMRDPEKVLGIRVVAKSKKLRQAVVALEEKERKLAVESSYTDLRRTNASIIKEVFPTLPNGTTYQVQRPLNGASGSGASGGEVTGGVVTVRATVPAGEVHLLVGYDEDHLFVSLLREKVTSVRGAHEALFPKELRERREGLLRQGEWFLSPATAGELREVQAAIKKKDLISRGALGANDHVATVLVKSHANGGFVTGLLEHPRHKALFLNGWYRAVRNNEVESSGSSWD